MEDDEGPSNEFLKRPFLQGIPFLSARSAISIVITNPSSFSADHLVLIHNYTSFSNMGRYAGMHSLHSPSVRILRCYTRWLSVISLQIKANECASSHLSTFIFGKWPTSVDIAPYAGANSANGHILDVSSGYTRLEHFLRRLEYYFITASALGTYSCSLDVQPRRPVVSFQCFWGMNSGFKERLDPPRPRESTCACLK